MNPENERSMPGGYLKDAPFVALTAHLAPRLWTSDAELRTGLRAKGFDRFHEPSLAEGNKSIAMWHRLVVSFEQS